MAPLRLSSLCRRFETLRRRARVRFLHWIASGAVIDECEGTALDEREWRDLSEAIDRARREGR